MFKIVLLLLNIIHIKKHMQKVPEQFVQQINLPDHLKAQRYTITKNIFSIITIIIHASILLLWLFAGGLSKLELFWTQQQLTPIWLGICFIMSFSLINSLLSLPETLYSTFIIEQRYGFNKTTPRLFIIDQVKQFILSITLGVPLLYGILYFLGETGPLWWFYTWIFLILFQFLIIWAYPKFIAPFFNKFTPLDSPELVKEIDHLSKKIDIQFKDYYAMNASIRSSHGNAYFTGFGKNKRIVFFDTLIETLNINEVIAVLAHELGHLKKKHIIKSIIIGVISMFIGFYILGQLYNSPEFFEAFNITSQTGYMALILFMLISPAYMYFLTPFSSYFSRKNEFEADYFAAEYTNANDLVSALLKMYKDNSSSLTPHPIYSKFYFSHPPASERVLFLENLAKKFNS